MITNLEKEMCRLLIRASHSTIPHTIRYDIDAFLDRNPHIIEALRVDANSKKVTE